MGIGPHSLGHARTAPAMRIPIRTSIQSGRIAVVHNGVIENYDRLKNKLTKAGPQLFQSSNGHRNSRAFDWRALRENIGGKNGNTNPLRVGGLRWPCAKVIGTYGLAVISCRPAEHHHRARAPRISAHHRHPAMAENFLGERRKMPSSRTHGAKWFISTTTTGRHHYGRPFRCAKSRDGYGQRADQQAGI